jgi:hypothetical protein
VAQLYSAGYRNGYISKDDLTHVNGGNLYKDAANAYNRMAAAAKREGINLKISDTYRSLEGPYGQIDTVGKKGWYGKAAPRGTTQTTGLAAQPGTSNHGWGLAIDFDQNLVWQQAPDQRRTRGEAVGVAHGPGRGVTTGPGSTAYNWLAANAANFGFSRDPTEPWHWNYIKPLETPIPKPSNPAPSGAPNTSTPVTTRSDYIEKIYKDPFKTDIDVRNEVLNRELPLFKNYLNEISKADVNVSSNYLAVITEKDLQGEFLLIDGVNSTQAKQQAQVKTLLDDKLKAFSPDAKYSLINSALFEILPDNMRNKMSENSAKGGANPNFSHAWRAPGKLSVTADFTIPGIAGLRIGQIFWIDRISEAYKSYGAFQLFGLTENIDISKGWTTSIHSRFNALPRSSKAKYLIDSSTDGQTVETATNATSQAK